jgi:alkyl hydroperoxide reductase subunit AhpC
MTTGRNFEEVLARHRFLAAHGEASASATPVNWKQGEDVIIAGSVNDEEAKKIYPQGLEGPRPYIRIVPQPK